MKKIKIILLIGLSAILLIGCNKPDKPPQYYTVNFAGEGVDIESQSIENGNYATEPENPERDGFDFDGWFIDNDTFANKWDFKNCVVTQDTTLYAKWEPCNIDDPLNNLIWLKEIVDRFEYDAVIFGYNPYARIYQCNYKNGVGFMLEMCVECPDAEYSFRNCEGIELCSGRGFSDVDNCSEFNIDLENKKLIWEKLANPLLEKLNLKPIEWIYDKFGNRVDKETGSLRLKKDEYFLSDFVDASEIALHYLKSNIEIFGLSDNPDDMKIMNISHSPAGEYVYLRQFVNNVLVYSTSFTIYIDKDKIVRYALNEFRNVSLYENIAIEPSIDNNQALKTAIICLNLIDVLDYSSDLVYFESIDKRIGISLGNRNSLKDSIWCLANFCISKRRADYSCTFSFDYIIVKLKIKYHTLTYEKESNIYFIGINNYLCEGAPTREAVRFRKTKLKTYREFG